MAGRQNLSGRGVRGRRGGGYGGGTLGNVFNGGSHLVNPMMEQYRRQQSGTERVNASDRARSRIARAQQTGVGRGTQEQTVRSSTPGGGGYNRQLAIQRERELAGKSLEEQKLNLGRAADPNAGGQPGQGGGRRDISQGFRGRGGFMGQGGRMARQAQAAGRGKQGGTLTGPARQSPARQRVAAARQASRTQPRAAAPAERTGGIGGALKRSPRSRGLRGRGIGRGMRGAF